MPIPTWLPLMLGLLSAVGPLSTDMYLPAFPAIEHSLGGHAGTAQVTLATWFLGLAIGQLTQGPLSDRWGRRVPLIAGTALYAVASVGCALAPSLAWLAGLRLLTGIGGSAGMVITRAIVRDLADGHAAVRLMSRLMLIMGAAPILAPSIGGLIVAVAPWQAIFVICAAYGALCCAMVLFCLPETLPETRRVKLSFGGVVSRYRQVIRERSFVTHTLMGGCCMFAMFAYLGGSPFVFIEIFHLSPPVYGALFGVCAFGFITCSQINPRVLPRFGGDRVMRAGVSVFLVAATAGLAAALAWPTGGPLGFLAAAVPIFFLMSSQGFTMPNSVVGALSRHAAHAGAASALLGTIHFCLGAVSGLSVGLLADGTVRPMAGLMFAGACGAVLFERLRPRSGRV
jgi:DHA1 family bicyclomycin/chloramphenicol resistance-like MFS transporter